MRNTVLIFLLMLLCITTWSTTTADLVYRNPRVYNVEFSFELVPDPAKIDRSRDLKLWLPIPREWDSQRAVKIISVNPPPHAEYEDPEHGNRMLFWDFGKEPEKTSYKIDIKYRLESYEIHAEVDPEHIGTYDKTSKEYALYTRSTNTISITPKIKELAQEAVGDEKNPYLQAERIFKFVRKKMLYKILDFERGRGIKCLLDFPVIDKETGEEYYEGACNQHSAFFIALCRAVGIPARSVQGIIGWNPWAKEAEKPLHDFETKLSPSGLAGAQDYGALPRHTWAEFYIPAYGWIPSDPTTGRFAHSGNKCVILCKDRDVKIGPEAPQEDNQGYGTHWVPLDNGRADSFQRAVWNIAKIHTARMKTLHSSDPFPADGLASYPASFSPKEDVEKDLRNWRKGALSWLSCFARSSVLQNLNVEQLYNDHPSHREDREAFVCHMLRRQLGDERFFKLVDTYIDLRQKSNQAIPASRFQELAENLYGEPLDWFFNQWVNNVELPRLKLERVSVSKGKEGWQVHGRLLQSGDAVFRLRIELVLETEKGIERQEIWQEKRDVDFEFATLDKPGRLMVDPDSEILKIQRMPPRLVWFWNVYPDLIVVYGTLAEVDVNKAAAGRFNEEYLGLGSEIIKADTDVTEEDLKARCVVLFGRPATNRIAQQFKEAFPIKIDGDEFTWQGKTYGEPTQGVAQITDNPLDPRGLLILYAGSSEKATIQICDSYLYDPESSYIIFDSGKELLSGDWEDVDSDMVWNFKANEE